METSKLLKGRPAALEPFSGRSDILVASTVPSGSNPRRQYLGNPTSIPAPVISSSPFIPSILIEHLMRRKKNSALAVKFKALSGTDEITNMEGVLHTYVTPICLSFLHGDYRYSAGHRMVRFSDIEAKSGSRKMQQARQVVISASVQPDFEGKQVMLRACALRESAAEGAPLPESFQILDVKSKQDDKKRNAYDTALRAHLIYHLTANHRVPSLPEVSARIVDWTAAMKFLAGQIAASEIDYAGIERTYIKLPNSAIISLEMLFNSAVQQLRNEISALEALCPQGYVLTIDPPSIFAQEIGAELLNRTQFIALKWLAEGGNTFEHMKVFAFNDYADRDAVRLIRHALQKQGHVQVVPKVQLFPAPRGLYQALPGTEKALLVVHNNSGTLIFHTRNNVHTMEWSPSSCNIINLTVRSMKDETTYLTNPIVFHRHY